MHLFISEIKSAEADKWPPPSLNAELQITCSFTNKPGTSPLNKSADDTDSHLD